MRASARGRPVCGHCSPTPRSRDDRSRTRADAVASCAHRSGVDFIVVGGVAAQIHGWRGATGDLDITLATDEPNVVRLNHALAGVGAGLPAIGALGTVLETRHGRLEIVRRADGIGEHSAWARQARPRIVDADLTVVAADPDDVLRSKEAAGREKELVALPQIRPT